MTSCHLKRSNFSSISIHSMHRKGHGNYVCNPRNWVFSLQLKNPFPCTWLTNYCYWCMLSFQNAYFSIPQYNQLQVLFLNPPFHTNDSPPPAVPLSVKPHLVTSIYLQINSTQIPKEASKKFHTFVTQRAKWPEGRGRWGVVIGYGGGERVAIKRSQMKW